MTDLNKLRSEFEAVTEIYHCIYNADLDYYFSGSKFASDKAEIEVNAGWKSWKKAKAQAVPETHLLIPKEPNRKTIMAMACVCLGSVGSGPEFLTLKEAKDVYSALVEKESGAEG
ncbi:hypothetical protein [Acinetobacter baumannii]|uniref:hypothetical protein n=1 Tax=Acinetobacter baumannii TaxID=470 RepID=UPI000598B3E8|nr:hypothetical protein [Acinetobacter baumannii]EHU2507906.1 hypothetical protein [Acinetobacter baumannii]EKV1654743.1 hypothetical protein [Acinetobacter baumannii]EKV1844853.1 hypothetical protein [Acinetobacter baumannii]EKV1973749.1 hypothetical protein [Acinetobacter baumannii]EKV3533214.1 hypothetical protein [Acinetobacter baumannii]